MRMNTSWIFFALLSAFMAALVAIFGKIGLRDVDANTATAMRAVIMAIFLMFVILFEGKISFIGSILPQGKIMLFIVLSGIAGALSWLFYFLALKSGKVYQVAPLDRLSVVFAVILAALFLGEKITLKIAIGAILIAVGAILIALG